jgi:hypothetical protein
LRGVQPAVAAIRDLLADAGGFEQLVEVLSASPAYLVTTDDRFSR